MDPKGGDNPTEMHVVMVVGMMLPIAGPDGQPIQAPFGALRFPLSKEFGTQFLTTGLEIAKDLKDAPTAKVDIATSMDGVADLAELAKKFRSDNG